MIYANFKGDYTYMDGKERKTKEVYNDRIFLQPARRYEAGVNASTIRSTLERYDSFPDYNFNMRNDVYDITNFDPSLSYHDIMFEKQRGVWEKLNDSITSKARSTHIFAFDFETLGIPDAKNLSAASAITEFGIADLKINYDTETKTSTLKPVRNYSFAFGINKDQAKIYLDELDMLSDTGFGISLDKQVRRAYQSDMERLSRYSGNITDVFRVQTGSVMSPNAATVIKNLAPSFGSDTDKILEGIINESILGGVTQEEMRSVLDGRYNVAKVKNIMDSFAKTETMFNNANLIVQGQDSKLIDTLKEYVTRRTTRQNQAVATFNGNVYDIPIFNAIGSGNTHKLGYDNTIDVYSAMEHITRGGGIMEYNSIAEAKRGNINIPGKMRQEGLASLLGLEFEDAAHNAGSDSLVTASIAANNDFMNGKSFIDNALGIKRTTMDEWGYPKSISSLNYLDKNTYLYANRSIMYEKNGLDVFKVNGEIASELYNTGVKRGRYYSLDSVLHDPDGGVVARFSAASKNADEVFYKHYNSQDELAESLINTFTPDSKILHGNNNKKMRNAIEYQEKLYWADYTRRNYDRYFTTESISVKGKQVHGGIEELNKYYQAYKDIDAFDYNAEGVTKDIAEQAEGFKKEFAKFNKRYGNSKMVSRDRIAASNEYDDFIRELLANNGLGYRKGNNVIVPDATVRNFKNFLGKFHDEKEVFEFINANINKLEKSNLSDVDFARMKTLIAGDIRERALKLGTWDANSNVPMFGLAGEKDLFSFDVSFVDSKGELRKTAIDFGAPNSGFNLYITARNEARKFSGDLEYNESKILGAMASSLKEKGVVTEDFMSTFTHEMYKTDVAARENRRYANDIATQVIENFVDPMRKAGWNLEELRKLGNKDYKPDGINEDLIKIAREKLQTYTGEYMFTAHATRNPGKTKETLSSVFLDNLDDMQKNTDSFIDRLRMGLNFSISYGDGTVDEIQDYLQAFLGYDETTAKQVGRSFTYATDKDGIRALNAFSNVDAEKTAYMTGFFHSGVQGDDAFVLLTKRDNIDRIIRETVGLQGNEFTEAIKNIEENGSAAVFKLPAIHEYNIQPIPEKDMNGIGLIDNLFTFTDVEEEMIDGERVYNTVDKNISYRTIRTGDNWEVISRQRYNTYYTGGDYKTLKNLVMQRTDDAQTAVNWFTPKFEDIKEELGRTDIPDSEKFKNISRRVRKFVAKKAENMPAPSGSLNSILDNGKLRFVQVPNLGDLLKSAQINSTPLQGIFMSMLQRDYELGNRRMADALADILGAQQMQDTGYNVKKTLDDIVSKFQDPSQEFKLEKKAAEFFNKTFTILTFKDQKLGDFDGTILDYMEDFISRNQGEVSDSVKANIHALYKDYKAGKISFAVSENAIDDGYFFRVDPHEIVPGSHSDSSMRPTFRQATTPKIFDPELIRQELGDDVIKRYNIGLDYDAKPLGITQQERAFRNFKITGTNVTLDKFRRSMSMEVRQIKSDEAYDLLTGVQKNIASVFTDEDILNAKALSKYGLRKDIILDLLQESANILVDTQAYNVYESRMVGNPLVFNNSYYSKDYLHKAKLSGEVTDKDAQRKLAEFLSEREETFNYGDDITEEYRKYLKRKNKPEEIILDSKGKNLIYQSHTEGKFSGSVEDIMGYLNGGEGRIHQAEEGIRLEKLLVGQEKGMAAFLEWSKNDPRNRSKAFDTLIDIFKKNKLKLDDKEQREIALNALGMVFEKAYGEGVSLIGEHPLGKHLNAYTNPIHNRMMNIAKNSDETGRQAVKALYEEAAENLVKSGVFKQGYKGLILRTYAGEFVEDSSELKNSGVISQIEEAKRLALEKAEQDGQHSIFKEIKKSFEYAEKYNLMRANASVIEDNESMGASKRYNARLDMALRSQDTELLKGGLRLESEDPVNFNAVMHKGEKVSVIDYFANEVYKRAYKNQEAGVKSAGVTISGISKAVNYLKNPKSLSERNAAILELSFENLTFTKNAGDTVEDVMEYGIFKATQKGHTNYGNTLKRAAKEQNININNVQAVSIKLPSGIKYKFKGKDFNEVILPVYEIQPYDGGDKFVRTDSIKAIQSTMNTIKEYGTNRGVTKDAELLNKRIENMYMALSGDITQKKDSYFMKHILTLDIPGSATFKSESINIPMIKGVVENAGNYKKWKTDSAYREEVIKAIREGIADENKVGFTTEGLALVEGNGKSYSRIIDGKMRYGAITEISEEAFKDKLGVDFVSSGYKILSTNEYENASKLSTGKSLNEVMSDFSDNQSRMKMMIDDVLDALGKDKNKIKKEEIFKLFKNKGKLLKQYAKAGEIEEWMANEMLSITENTTREYLEKVGAFGYTGRDPMFHGGSAPVTFVRLDKNLARDEMRMNPIIALLLNNDNDGDTPNATIFHNNGTLANSNDNLFKSFRRKYESKMMREKYSMNEILSNLFVDQADAITTNGGILTDAVIGDGKFSVYSKAIRLDKGMSDIDKDEVIQILREQGADFTTGKTDEEVNNYISDLITKPQPERDIKNKLIKSGEFYTDKELKQVEQIFTAWDSVAGNFKTNKFMNASAAKSIFIKHYIGHISKINYSLNEAMLDTIYKYTHDDGISQAAKDNVLRIKEDLHLDNTGFFVEVEQKAIDVKHVRAGLTISDTPEYQQGIKEIFNVKRDIRRQREGLAKMYDALQGNKAFATDLNKTDFINEVMGNKSYNQLSDPTVQKVRSLVDLSRLFDTDQLSNINNNSLDRTITKLQDAEALNYELNNLINENNAFNFDRNPYSPRAQYRKAILERNEIYKLAYHLNDGIRNDIKVDLIENSLYFDTSMYGAVTGRPDMYRYKGFTKNNKGQYILDFDLIDYDTLDRKVDKYKTRASKNKKTVYRTLTITGDTADEVAEELQRRFGNFDTHSMSEVRGWKDAGWKELLDKEKEITARRFLKERMDAGRNNVELTYEDFMKTRGDRAVHHKNIEEMSEFLKDVQKRSGDIDQYIDFEHNIRYIKENIVRDRKEVNLDSILTEINSQIISEAKDKKTATSPEKIFKSHYERIGQEIGRSGLGNEIANKSIPKVINGTDFSGFFNGKDEAMHDFKAARDEYATMAGDFINDNEINKHYEDYIGQYSKANNELYKTVWGENNTGGIIRKEALSNSDVDTLFGYDSGKLGDMRVGFDITDDKRFFGRKFNTLSESDITEILNMTYPDDRGSYYEYAFQQTNKNLKSFRDTEFDASKVQKLQGLSEEHHKAIQKHLKDLNDNLLRDGKINEEKHRENARRINQMVSDLADGNSKKGTMADYGQIKKTLGDAWEKVSGFVKEHPKQTGIAAAALLGLSAVNGFMNRQSSPLAPDISAKRGDNGIGHGKKLNKRPQQQTIYENPGDGLNYKMSASSLRKVNQVQAAQMGAMPLNGSTDVNIYDDRKPVSDQWLQEKVANYI